MKTMSDCRLIYELFMFENKMFNIGGIFKISILEKYGTLPIQHSFLGDSMGPNAKIRPG